MVGRDRRLGVLTAVYSLCYVGMADRSALLTLYSKKVCVALFCIIFEYVNILMTPSLKSSPSMRIFLFHATSWLIINLFFFTILGVRRNLESVENADGG